MRKENGANKFLIAGGNVKLGTLCTQVGRHRHRPICEHCVCYITQKCHRNACKLGNKCVHIYTYISVIIQNTNKIAHTGFTANAKVNVWVLFMLCRLSPNPQNQWPVQQCETSCLSSQVGSKHDLWFVAHRICTCQNLPWSLGAHYIYFPHETIGWHELT